MSFTRRHMVVLSFAFVVGGCDGSPASNSVVVPLTVSARYLPLQEVNLGSFRGAVQGGQHRLIVREKISTGACHGEPNYSAVQKGGVITLTLNYPRPKLAPDELCPLVAIERVVEATISSVRPGTYQVQIEYVGDVQRGSEQDHVSGSKVEITALNRSGMIGEFVA